MPKSAAYAQFIEDNIAARKRINPKPGDKWLTRNAFGTLREVECYSMGYIGVELTFDYPNIPKSLLRPEWSTSWTGLEKAIARV